MEFNKCKDLSKDILSRGLNINDPAEVMLIHNDTNISVSKLCGKYEQEVLYSLIERYLIQKEEVLKYKKAIELVNNTLLNLNCDEEEDISYECKRGNYFYN